MKIEFASDPLGGQGKVLHTAEFPDDTPFKLAIDLLSVQLGATYVDENKPTTTLTVVRILIGDLVLTKPYIGS